ncbi:MAG TPA: sugar phosphate nucleotidyltransferase [Candidatus Peribacterales bacterium]|nr:sugar phosphate nucleotidyltransferase [Candidatus Peribacterales bacterium]
MKLTQAILPLAGLGTRFLPWTKVVPKELLPIGNKPIVALLVDECIAAGISEICFVISKGKEAIPEYFYEDAELEAELKRRGKIHLLEELRRYDSVKFHVVYQDEQRGDGHAILQAADWVNSDQVAVLFGDDLITGADSGLVQLKSHYSEGALLCLQDVPKEKVSSYGIADVEETKDRLKVVKGLVEKPKPAEAPSTLGIVGRYILPKRVFDVLHSVGNSHASRGLSTSGGEIRIIDALISELGRMPVHGLVFEGSRYDTGTPEGYREAVIALG